MELNLLSKWVVSGIKFILRILTYSIVGMAAFNVGILLHYFDFDFSQTMHHMMANSAEPTRTPSNTSVDQIRATMVYTDTKDALAELDSQVIKTDIPTKAPRDRYQQANRSKDNFQRYHAKKVITKLRELVSNGDELTVHNFLCQKGYLHFCSQYHSLVIEKIYNPSRYATMSVDSHKLLFFELSYMLCKYKFLRTLFACTNPFPSHGRQTTRGPRQEITETLLRRLERRLRSLCPRSYEKRRNEKSPWCRCRCLS